nr:MULTISPECIES: DNA cytosine methyltransferase [unclassified Campylobacter]
MAGICSHDSRRTIKIIINSFKEINYQPIFKVINAKDVDYSQNRTRWYCVGFDKSIFKNINDSFEFAFPKKKNLKYSVDSLIENVVSNNYLNTKICQNNILTHIDKFKKSKRFNNKYILLAYEVRKSRCNFRCDGISPCITAKMGTGGNNVPIVVE